MAKAEQRSPLAPAPLQDLQRYYGLLRPCPAYRYSRPRDWRRLWLVPSRRPSKASGVTQCRFSRSIRKPGRASRRLHAGCHPGHIRHPPSWSRRKGHPPVLTSPNPLSTLHRRFACARLSRPCRLDFMPRLDCNAHHHGFCPQQLTVAWDQHLIAEPEGPSFISRTVARRRLDRLRSWHTTQSGNATAWTCAV